MRANFLLKFCNCVLASVNLAHRRRAHSLHPPRVCALCRRMLHSLHPRRVCALRRHVPCASAHHLCTGAFSTVSNRLLRTRLASHLLQAALQDLQVPVFCLFSRSRKATCKISKNNGNNYSNSNDRMRQMRMWAHFSQVLTTLGRCVRVPTFCKCCLLQARCDRFDNLAQVLSALCASADHLGQVHAHLEVDDLCRRGCMRTRATPSA